MKTCTKCGSSGPFGKDKNTKDGLKHQCKSCCTARVRKWAADHPERKKASNKLSHEKHREERSEKAKARYKENPEPAQARAKARYHADPDRVKAEAAAWRRENYERFSATRRAYRNAHPEYRNARNHARRARIAGNGGSYTPAEWDALLDQTGHRCLACGASDVPLTVDHIIPVSAGGKSSIDNLQPLCKSCNSRKSSQTIDFLVRKPQ